MLKEKNQKGKIIIEYEKDKLLKIFLLAKYIDEQIKLEQAVPSIILNELLNCFERYDPLQKLAKQIDAHTEKCHKYLSSVGYDFSVERDRDIIIGEYRLNIDEKDRQEAKTQKITEELNLYKLIKECFEMIINIDTYTFIRISNNRLISMIYETINNKLKDFDNASIKTYTRYVITGRIASSIGLIDSKKTYCDYHHKKTGYNKFLYDEIRNKLKKHPDHKKPI
jgi:hypothetical protein